MLTLSEIMRSLARSGCTARVCGLSKPQPQHFFTPLCCTWHHIFAFFPETRNLTETYFIIKVYTSYQHPSDDKVLTGQGETMRIINSSLDNPNERTKDHIIGALSSLILFEVKSHEQMISTTTDMSHRKPMAPIKSQLSIGTDLSSCCSYGIQTRGQRFIDWCNTSSYSKWIPTSSRRMKEPSSSSRTVRK